MSLRRSQPIIKPDLMEEDLNGPIEPFISLTQSAPPVFRSGHHDPYIAIENKKNELYAFGCKILSYFAIATPANSPTKKNPANKQIESQQQHYISSRLFPSISERFVHQDNKAVRHININHNRYHALLMDVARSLKTKIDSLDDAQFIRHIKNWKVEFDNEQQYRTLKSCAPVDLIILMYFIKRYSNYAFSHFDFLSKLNTAPQATDWLVLECDRLERAEKRVPVELYDMEWPVNPENVAVEKPSVQYTVGGFR